MCRSAREGGQRCHTHALNRLHRVSADYRAAVTALPSEPSDADKSRVKDLYDTVRSARVEYASTPKGERELHAQAIALEANGRHEGAEDLRTSIRKGLELRKRNYTIGASAENNSAYASLTHLADRRAGDDYASVGLGRRTVAAIERKSLRARYDGFRRMAEAEPTLHAPRGWAASRRDLTAPTEQGKVRSRAGQYALWRATRDVEGDAPALPDGMHYQRTSTPWRDLRPGDFLVEPGYRAPGDVEHEGKVVEHVEHLSSGGGAKVRFADATTDTRQSTVFTVLRPVNVDSEARLARYHQILGGADSASGHDEHGAWAATRDGERVYA